MTTSIPPECPTFGDWYRDVNRRDPFPWQERLANQVAAGSDWPELVGIPTGLGKTACIDIAIWALAYQAHLRPQERNAPTRIWWVVNRRLLVDDTYIHAERVAELLARAKTGPLADVASRLRYLTGRADSVSPPLETIRMRGGNRRGGSRVAISRAQRPSSPAQPAVICSTIPMFGSRILFRGYGSSRGMRPIDAALAYTDSLVIIDEAHLAEHLQQLLSDLARLESAEAAPLPPGRRSPVVVALTATGDPDAQRFELDSADHDNPTVTKRLDASKPVHVEVARGVTTPTKVAAGIVSSVKELITVAGPAVTLVFVNSPITARLVGKRLLSVADTEVEIATGQIRGYEAENVTARILSEAGSEVERGTRSKHLVVVATQTLEVGADIDADYLVTEACGVRALTQRLGRLNRLGERPHAKGVYIHTPGKDGLWPVYGEEPATVVERLQRCADGDGIVNLSPRRVADVLGEPRDRPDPAPVVAPGLLWEWTKTTTPPPGEAPVDPYFSGFDEQQRHVTVAWRAYLPEAGQKLWPGLAGNETVAVLLRDVAHTLEKLGDQDSWVLIDSTNRIATGGSPHELKPGDTVLLHPDVGLLDRHGHWEKAADDLVQDVSVLEAGLPVEPGALKQIYGRSLKEALEIVKKISHDRDDGDTPGVTDLCRQLCVTLLSKPPPPWTQDGEWANFVASLEVGLDERISTGQPALVEPRGEVPHLPLPGRDGQRASTVPSDEDDELSLSLGGEDPSSLDGHGAHTAQETCRVATALGLPDTLSRVVVNAARWHDIGKADQRFQRWLDPGREPNDALRAKSGQPRSGWATNRVRAGWPRGGRHEELSRRLIEKWLANYGHGLKPEEAELLQHLVVSHHGQGRPLVPPVADTTCGSSLTYELKGLRVKVSPDLASSDWNQPTRFASLNARYGPWGLALLETIVRQSDWIASSVVEVQ